MPKKKKTGSAVFPSQFRRHSKKKSGRVGPANAAAGRAGARALDGRAALLPGRGSVRGRTWHRGSLARALSSSQGESCHFGMLACSALLCTVPRETSWWSTRGCGGGGGGGGGRGGPLTTPRPSPPWPRHSTPPAVAQAAAGEQQQLLPLLRRRQTEARPTPPLGVRPISACAARAYIACNRTRAPGYAIRPPHPRAATSSSQPGTTSATASATRQSTPQGGRAALAM